MKWPFERSKSDEDRLKSFTAVYSKRKSIQDIGHDDLKRWKKLTDKTDGRFTRAYMAPSLWADSVASLQTALAVVLTYTPDRLHGEEASAETVTKLRLRILKELAPRKQVLKRKH